MAKNNNIRLLEKEKIPFQSVTYTYDEEDLSVNKIATENNLPIEQIFKTLVNITNTGEVLIALVSGLQEINHKKLANLASAKKVEMVPVKDLQKLTGYIRGGCSPLGLKKPYRIFIDDSILSLPIAYINAGQRGLLLGIAPKILIQLTNATVGDLHH